MERINDFRNVFAQVVVSRAGCPHNQRLFRAFERVPRHDFLGPGPWIVREDGTRTAGDDPAIIYQDMGIGLAEGIPTGLPSLHARFLDMLQPMSGECVMQVGAGSGYFTAILAELVGETGRVIAYEINASLATRAERNLKPWPWVSVESRSGITSTDDPVDLVYVNAGVQELPTAWVYALRPGGRLLFPLVAERGHGVIFIVTRIGNNTYSARSAGNAQFVPCIGTQDTTTCARLASVLRDDTSASVRSLRLAPDQPDESAWFAGAEWWLSTYDNTTGVA